MALARVRRGGYGAIRASGQTNQAAPAALCLHDWQIGRFQLPYRPRPANGTCLAALARAAEGRIDVYFRAHA